MKQTALIALLTLAAFTTLPATAADTPAAAPEAATAATPQNLSAPSKPPCVKPGMGPGMGMGMGAGMPGKMMMGEGRPCPKAGTPCANKYDKGMSERVEQLEKRLDALQMTVELLVRQQGE
ncbi:MAG: hypothetical protein Q8M09_02305 [Pseudomonadota bacterium]|nr:hypothetical protein [Pseudomonadota bacterium]MDP1903074.1 hypothetical protein [Pseudomonadota bacterium]MDP2353064.1 hypothetical protein [Pseudomonadota bacterium]